MCQNKLVRRQQSLDGCRTQIGPELIDVSQGASFQEMEKNLSTHTNKSLTSCKIFEHT